MSDDANVEQNLTNMDNLDFVGYNHGDWHGEFARYHTDDVLVDMKGTPVTHGLEDHIAAMRGFIDGVGGNIPQIVDHPIRFGSGEWTCVVGKLADGSRMVTVARWRDGRISEEYIWG